MSKIFKVIGIIVVTFLLLAVFAGCASTALKSIAASPASISLVAKGTQQLKITATVGSKTEDVTTKSTYTSSDTKIATVSNKGLVTAVAKGSAKVTVSYTANKVTKTATVPVTVK